LNDKTAEIRKKNPQYFYNSVSKEREREGERERVKKKEKV
jgi:hypothetical protein